MNCQFNSYTHISIHSPNNRSSRRETPQYNVPTRLISSVFRFGFVGSPVVSDSRNFPISLTPALAHTISILPTSLYTSPNTRACSSQLEMSHFLKRKEEEGNSVRREERTVSAVLAEMSRMVILEDWEAKKRT